MAKDESVEILGHWAEKPKDIIELDYLLALFSNKEASWPMEVRLRKGQALALKLGVANGRNEA